MAIVNNYCWLVHIINELKQAVAEKNYKVAPIYAGEAVGLVTRQRPAAEVVQSLSNEAEQLLRSRLSSLLGD